MLTISKLISSTTLILCCAIGAFAQNFSSNAASSNSHLVFLAGGGVLLFGAGLAVGFAIGKKK